MAKTDAEKRQEAADAKRQEEADARRQQAHDLVDERHDRAEAVSAPVQKVTDGNETAALDTVTGQKPVRDMSDAPEPNELGPHHSDSPDDDPAKANDPVGDG